MTKPRPRCDSCGLTDRKCSCVPKQKSVSIHERAREMFGMSIDESKIKVIPLKEITITEKMIEEYEEDLETISELQNKLMKFGFHANQLHPLRRQKYASKLKNQKEMWGMLGKNMIGDIVSNLRYVRTPHCNIEIPLFKDETN